MLLRLLQREWDTAFQLTLVPYTLSTFLSAYQSINPSNGYCVRPGALADDLLS